MENLNLNQLEQLLAAKSQEVEIIKAELISAKQLLVSAEQKLFKLAGQQLKTEEKKPLRIFVKNVLANTNEPLTVKEIEELVLEVGYKTSSKKNFRNIIQQVLVNDSEFKRVTKPKTRPSRYALEEV